VSVSDSLRQDAQLLPRQLALRYKSGIDGLTVTVTVTLNTTT